MRKSRKKIILCSVGNPKHNIKFCLKVDVLSQVRDVKIMSLAKQAVTSVDTDHIGLSCVGITIIVRETQTQFHISPTAQKYQLVKYLSM